jgi:hypothetical protein
MSNLDIDKAIAAHLDMCKSLRDLLNDTAEEKLDIGNVRDHGLCVLGKWLRNDGKKYTLFTQYFELASEHEKFHDSAADVIRFYDAGDIVQARKQLEHHVTLQSAKVVDLLEELKLDGL